MKHQDKRTNVTFFDLAKEHPDLLKHIPTNLNSNDDIERQVVFDSFLMKLLSDLNTEELKNQKKIIKRQKRKINGVVEITNIQKDYQNKVLYGILHGGKITKNVMLERVNEEQNEEEYEYDTLDGDRLYEDFFFLLHISFRTNVARLFILSQKDSTKTDAIFKNYLSNKLFKGGAFGKAQATDFIPTEYRDDVLRRSLVNNIAISKTTTIITESDGVEYDVEIRLKPKSQRSFSQMIERANIFQRSKVTMENSSTDDEDSPIKFTLKDPNTNTSKTLTVANADNFIPRLSFEDEQIQDENKQLDLEKLKSLCMEYVSYDNNDNLI
ncbi:MAG TPA: hypothetical protein PLP27_10205 [Crocinitomicaceae bacterium]|nr:hypothetical protein [Crocinitomicaceae bacterium]